MSGIVSQGKIESECISNQAKHCSQMRVPLFLQWPWLDVPWHPKIFAGQNQLLQVKMSQRLCFPKFFPFKQFMELGI